MDGVSVSAVIGYGIASAVFAWMWACAADGSGRKGIGIMAVGFALMTAAMGLLA